MSSRAVRLRVWRVPVLLASLSALGLGSALVANGVGDVLGWLGLATPVAVAVRYSLPSVQRSLVRAPRPE